MGEWNPPSITQNVANDIRNRAAALGAPDLAAVVHKIVGDAMQAQRNGFQGVTEGKSLVNGMSADKVITSTATTVLTTFTFVDINADHILGCLLITDGGAVVGVGVPYFTVEQVKIGTNDEYQLETGAAAGTGLNGALFAPLTDGAAGRAFWAMGTILPAGKQIKVAVRNNNSGTLFIGVCIGPVPQPVYS